MDFDYRIKDILNVNETNPVTEGAASQSKESGSIFNGDKRENIPDGVTNERINLLITKLEVYAAENNLDIISAAQVLADGFEVNPLPKEKLDELPLGNKNEIAEAVELVLESGDAVFYLKYIDGTNETFYPDNSVSKYNSHTKVRIYYKDGRASSVEYKDGIFRYEADENGNFIGHAIAGESVNDVLRRLKISPDCEEAKKFLELNKDGIKSFKGGKVQAFMVGAEVIIPPELVENAHRYLALDPKNEREYYQRMRIDEKGISERAERYKYSHKLVTVNRGDSWWSVAKESLIYYGVKNPSNAEISDRVLLLKEINENKPLVAGETVKIPYSKEDLNRFTPKHYRIDALKKQYPDDKYDIELREDTGSLRVYKKGTKQEVLIVNMITNDDSGELEVFASHIYDDGNKVRIKYSSNGLIMKYNETKTKRFVFYDEDGNIETELIDGKTPQLIELNLVIDKLVEGKISPEMFLLQIKDMDIQKIKPYEIAAMDHKEILNGMGDVIYRLCCNTYMLPKEKRVALVKAVTDKYIQQYECPSGIKRLLDRAVNNLDFNKIAVCLYHLLYIDPKSDYTRDCSVEANGMIDADFKQGHLTGHCWMLATMKSITNNPVGRKKLNSLITRNQDGSVTVEMKGVGQKFVISKEQIQKSFRGFSDGDDDVKAVEIAVWLYLLMCGGNQYPYLSDSYGGTTADFMRLFFDKDYKEQLIPSNQLLKYAKKENCMITVSAEYGKKKETEIKAYDMDTGEDVELIDNHMYSVIGADDKNFYISNPYDSAQLIVISHKDFYRFFDNGTVISPEDFG